MYVFAYVSRAKKFPIRSWNVVSWFLRKFWSYDDWVRYPGVLFTLYKTIICCGCQWLGQENHQAKYIYYKYKFVEMGQSIHIAYLSIVCIHTVYLWVPNVEKMCNGLSFLNWVWLSDYSVRLAMYCQCFESCLGRKIYYRLWITSLDHNVFCFYLLFLKVKWIHFVNVL